MNNLTYYSENKVHKVNRLPEHIKPRISISKDAKKIHYIIYSLSWIYNSQFKTFDIKFAKKYQWKYISKSYPVISKDENYLAKKGHVKLKKTIKAQIINDYTNHTRQAIINPKIQELNECKIIRKHLAYRSQIPKLKFLKKLQIACYKNILSFETPKMLRKIRFLKDLETLQMFWPSQQFLQAFNQFNIHKYLTKLKYVSIGVLKNQSENRQIIVANLIKFLLLTKIQYLEFCQASLIYQNQLTQQERYLVFDFRKKDSLSLINLIGISQKDVDMLIDQQLIRVGSNFSKLFICLGIENEKYTDCCKFIAPNKLVTFEHNHPFSVYNNQLCEGLLKIHLKTIKLNLYTYILQRLINFNHVSQNKILQVSSLRLFIDSFAPLPLQEVKSIVESICSFQELEELELNMMFQENITDDLLPCLIKALSKHSKSLRKLIIGFQGAYKMSTEFCGNILNFCMTEHPNLEILRLDFQKQCDLSDELFNKFINNEEIKQQNLSLKEFALYISESREFGQNEKQIALFLQKLKDFYPKLSNLSLNFVSIPQISSLYLQEVMNGVKTLENSLDILTLNCQNCRQLSFESINLEKNQIQESQQSTLSSSLNELHLNFGNCSKMTQKFLKKMIEYCKRYDVKNRFSFNIEECFKIYDYSIIKQFCDRRRNDTGMVSQLKGARHELQMIH